jgi:hypothetical protein
MKGSFAEVATPFAKGSLSGSWTGFAALSAYGGNERAFAGDATIPGDRPVGQSSRNRTSRVLLQPGGSMH